jgi:hypothetical protein
MHWKFFKMKYFDLLFLKCHDFLHLLLFINYFTLKIIQVCTWSFQPITCLATYIGYSINNILQENIKNNYNIYILIIVITVKIVVSVKCQNFKMSKISHLNMLLP